MAIVNITKDLLQRGIGGGPSTGLHLPPPASTTKHPHHAHGGSQAYRSRSKINIFKVHSFGDSVLAEK